MVKLAIILAVLFCTEALAQSIEYGPYTVTELSENIFNIEDSNARNPAGFHFDESGQRVGMNNSSDMYLIVGEERALLIDLSNAIEWTEGANEGFSLEGNNSAPQILRDLVSERLGSNPLTISVTHSHGDHIGMLPAFSNEPGVNFWLSAGEFQQMDSFSSLNVEYFQEGARLSLGGLEVKSFELPGHTLHSTLFFLEEKNMVFTGDAVGSGSGVWLFDDESFAHYSKSIDRLLAYLENSQIDLDDLTIHSAHSWQYGDLEKLTIQYLYDMQTLVEKIETGEADASEFSTFIPFLDTNFHYGAATITWNNESAQRLRDSQVDR